MLGWLSQLSQGLANSGQNVASNQYSQQIFLLKVFYLIMVDITQLGIELEIWDLLPSKISGGYPLSHNFMILLQTSKQISFPYLHHTQKSLEKRNQKVYCINWWDLFKVSPKFFESSLCSRSGPDHFLSKMSSLVSRLLRFSFKTFKILGQQLHLPISLRLFFPYISYILLLFPFCLHNFTDF